MSSIKDNGYPYPPEVHAHLDALIANTLRMRSNAVHPDGHGAGATILYRDGSGLILTVGGHSVRQRDEDVRFCAERSALQKLQRLADIERVEVLAIAVSAAVREDKDFLSFLLDVRPPCSGCRKMMHESPLFGDDTPVIMINPDRTLVIHPFGHLRKIYDRFPG